MKMFAVLMLAFPIGATTLVAQSTPAASDPVVITAGGITIKQSELEAAVSSLPADYQTYARGEGKRQFAQDYLRMRLLADAGMKAGLANDPEVVKQLELMRANLIASAYLKSIEANIRITDAELRPRYEATRSQGDVITASHILVAFKGSPAAQQGKPELTEAQAKAKADALHAQILAGGSFADIAKKESDDIESGKNGGALGEFGRGQMVEEFDKAAFEAPLGKLAPVTRTQFGYHIIRVDNRRSTPFEQVRAELLKQEKQARVQAELAKMASNAKPVFNEAYFGPKKP